MIAYLFIVFVHIPVQRFYTGANANNLVMLWELCEMLA